MKTIVALTHGRDESASMVLRELAARDAACVRFNTEEFHSKIRATVELGADGSFRGRFAFPDRHLDFEDIGVVWNRRVHEPDPDPELEAYPDIQEWAGQETLWAMKMIFTLFGCPVVNPWEINERLKFNKMLQLRRAAEIGFKIPESIVTDEPGEMKDFWARVDREVIFKKIRQGFMRMNDGRRLLVHTNRIPPELQNDASIDRMRFAPMFFERHVPKKFDVRSIVVGERVFSIAIASQGVAEGVVDYRKAAILGKMDQLPHERIELGKETDEKLIRFVKSFDLTFGAIDLIVTPRDEIVFLEDNPNGQWGWLEQVTGAPIAAAIAEKLIDIRNAAISVR